MREILFRGQTRRKGEKVNLRGEPIDGNWVYGGIFPGQGDFSMIYTYEPMEKHTVYTETVGQYTGLTDKNGTRIFEGDIVNLHYFFENHDPYTLGEFEDEAEIVCKIAWFELGWGFEKYDKTWDYLKNYIEDVREEIEVIGNIHDNPELLEDAQ